MAKLGVASLTGQAVASGIRGGSTSVGVVRAGGVESGRAAVISSKDARVNDSRGADLNSFLKTFVPVTQPRQINFKPQASQGFESIRPLGPLNNLMPEALKKPDLKPASLAQPDVVKPEVNNKPGADRGTIQFAVKSADKPGEKTAVETSPDVKGNAQESVGDSVKPEIKPAQKIETPAINIRQILGAGPAIGFAPDENSRRLDLIRAVTLQRIQESRSAGRRFGIFALGSPRTQAQHQEQSEAPIIPNTAEDFAQNNHTPVKRETQKKVHVVKRKAEKIVSRRSERDIDRRKKYAKRDWRMDAFRLNVLIENFESVRGEDPQAEDIGARVARRSLIGSMRAARSIFLDQRGYLDRADGTQKRIELMLEATRAINREKLREIINRNNALKEDERADDIASQRQVDEVVNEPNIVNRRYEPVAVVSKTSVSSREIVIENDPVSGQSAGVIESQPKAESILDGAHEESKASAEGAPEKSEVKEHNMGPLSGESIIMNLPIFGRREIVFNL